VTAWATLGSAVIDRRYREEDLRARRLADSAGVLTESELAGAMPGLWKQKVESWRRKGGGSSAPPLDEIRPAEPGIF
jgi:hypothetical protein